MELIEDLFKYVAEAVREGLKAVASANKDGKYIGTYADLASISYGDNGLPRFYKNPYKSPKNYTNVFYSWGTRLVEPSSLNSFQELFKYLDSQPAIQERLLPPRFLEGRKSEKSGEFNIDILEASSYSLAVELINRYIHIAKKFEFDESIFSVLFGEYTASIFEKELFVDICVPILFVKFDFDILEILPFVFIEKMSDAFQQARYPIKSYGPSVHKSVMTAATHMLCLKNWHFPNECQGLLYNYISDTSVYPLDEIDNFFASMRIKKGLKTGYAQLLMRPLGWAFNYQAHLPALYGTSLRAYPYSFENYYWNDQNMPEISLEETKEIAGLYEKISDVENNNILIAINRLNRCYLREDYEDSVLDATIGLEALFGDDSRQEMTHKIALRAAALSSLPPLNNTEMYQVFRDIKTIYGYRSKVVHGKTKKKNQKEIKPHHAEASPESNLALAFLRKLLEVILYNPKFERPSEIDKKLLLGDIESN